MSNALALTATQQMTSRKLESRELERNGFKGEILGAAKNCQLWINGKQYPIAFTSLRAARLVFIGYAKRHAT